MDRTFKFRRCWYGGNMVLLTSWTEKNPGRRFWKCESQNKTNTREFRHYFEWHDPPIEERSKLVINGLLRRLSKIEQEKLYELDSMASCSSTGGSYRVETSKVRANNEFIQNHVDLVRGIQILFVVCMFVLGIAIGMLL
ncbi:hypothetical protein LINGRAHAP2_LOCUS5610 [Linum grandiflorum]